MKNPLFFVLCIVLLLTVSVCSADLSGKPQTGLLYQTDSGQAPTVAGDKSVYDRAYKLYENKSYYNAYKLFVESQYGDWERMANKCIRKWPKNGEVYHDSTQWLRDTQLTFRVEQPEDTAIFFRVYKDDAPISYVFIGGTGEVTVGLPGNQTYTIKDGVGSDWFGTEDSFGENGAYETMTFGDMDDTKIYLQRTLDYVITVNIDDVIGDPIGSEDTEWGGFKK